MAEVNENKKDCFVIAPIGEDGSDTRNRSDIVLDHIIRPAVELKGYTPVRADEIDRPGIITNQVIEQILDAPLVIADLTERNPNVFYELAVRHVTRKPLIHLMQEGEGVPFDVAGTRIIFLDHTSLVSADQAKQKIVEQIESLENDPLSQENPISVSVDLQHLRQSEVPQERSLADMLSAVSEVRNGLSNLTEMITAEVGSFHRRDIQDLHESLSTKIDAAISAAKSANRREPRVSSRNLRNILHQSSGNYRFLVLLSAFRTNAPWIYEVGIEAYRRAMSGDMREAEEIIQDLEEIIMSSRSYLPEFADPTGELRMLMSELPSSFRELMSYRHKRKL